MQEKIRIRMDALIGELGKLRMKASPVRGRVAVCAADVAEESLAALDGGVVDVAARGDRERAGVENDIGEQGIADFGAAARSGCAALGLSGCARLVRKEAGGDADVSVECARDLLPVGLSQALNSQIRIDYANVIEVVRPKACVPSVLILCIPIGQLVNVHFAVA